MRAARQQFERGFMLWFDYGGGLIFAIAEDGWWRGCPDEWDGQSEPPIELPPSGKIRPLHGFGYVWEMHNEVRDRLGWATTGEQAGQGECSRDEDAWHIAFGDDYSATLECPVKPEPEPEPEPEPTPEPGPTPEPAPEPGLSSSTDWVWLPTLDMPFNLAFVAFVNKHGRCQFGPYDMLLTLPEKDTEFVREELRRRCKPPSS